MEEEGRGRGGGPRRGGSVSGPLLRLLIGVTGRRRGTSPGGRGTIPLVLLTTSPTPHVCFRPPPHPSGPFEEGMVTWGSV